MMDETAYDKSAPPPSYEERGGGDGGNYSQSSTHTTTVTQTATLGMNKDYIRTVPGILKIIEIVLSLTCLICTAVTRGSASGWGGFVAGCVLFASLLWFFFYLFNIINKIHPIRILIEWIYYLILSIFFFIASIVSAVYAGSYPAYGAYAFFGFLCTGALAVDLFFQFRVWRTEGHTSTHTATTTTTGDSSHVEVRY